MANIVIIPLRIAYMEGHDNIISGFTPFDVLCDVCYIADIVLRSNYLVLYEGQGSICSRDKIRKHYWYSRQFKLHLLAFIPLDIVLVIVGNQMMLPGIYLSMQQAIALYRLLKLLRFLDLPSHFSLIEDKLARYFSDYFKVMIRMCNLIFAVVILVHVFGCALFVVGDQQHLYGVENNWADNADLLRNCSTGNAVGQNENPCDGPTSMQQILNQYVVSIYWATATLTTVGFGDISAVSSIEQTFAMMLFLVGTAAYTIIVTNLEDLVSHMDVTSYIHKNRLGRLENFLHREQVSENFLRKNALYHDKIWALSRGAQGKEVKSFLPTNVYSALVSTVMKESLYAMFFFRERTNDFLADICERMVLQTYIESDVIFHSFEAANVLYFIVKGKVAAINYATGHVYEKIMVGEDYRMGSTEFFCREVYRCTGQALTDVLTFELTYNDFWQVVELHSLEDNFAQELATEEEALKEFSTQRFVDQDITIVASRSRTSLSKTRPKFFDKQSFNILGPDSSFFRVWTIVSILFLIYVSVTVPYFIAFREFGLEVVVLDCFLVVFWAFDIYLRLTKFSMCDDGDLIIDRSRITQLYIRHYFARDFISMLPAALCLYVITRDNTLFAVMRILYLGRLFRIYNHLSDFVEMFLSLTSTTFVFPPEKVRVLKIMVAVCYMAHVSGCIMCLIGKEARDRGKDNWIDANLYTGLPNTSIYLRSYFWATYTIVTVGFGSVQISSNSEKIFAMVVMIIGAIVCDAGVTAMLSSIIANSDFLSGVTRRSKEAMLQFCKSHQYSDDIQKNVALYYDYLSSTLQNSVEVQDFHLLPPALQVELAELHAFDPLCSLCLLDTDSTDLQLGFVHSLLRHIEPTIAIPGHVILGVGGLDVHVLRRGKAYSRVAGLKSLSSKRDYYQIGEALCREGRLSHSTPGKLVHVRLMSLEGEQSIPESQKGGGHVGLMRGQSKYMFGGTSFFGGLANAGRTSSVHARLCCGVKKLTSRSKPFTFKGGKKKRVVKWDESFMFHVPKSATNVKILYFDKNQTVDDGYMGMIEIYFDEMQVKAESISIVKDDDVDDCSKPKSGDGGDIDSSAVRVGRVLQRLYSSVVGESEVKNKSASVGSGDKSKKVNFTVTQPEVASTATGVLNTDGCGPENGMEEDRELKSFSDDENSTNGVTNGDNSADETTSGTTLYHMKEELCNIRGKVIGVSEIEVAIKGAAVADYTKGSKAQVCVKILCIFCACVNFFSSV